MTATAILESVDVAGVHLDAVVAGRQHFESEDEFLDHADRAWCSALSRKPRKD